MPMPTLRSARLSKGSRNSVERGCVDNSMQDDPQTTPGFKLPDTVHGSPSPNGEADRGAKTMTKAELAEALFDRLGLNKREAKDMVDGFFDEIRQALERGESVKLSGFGNFQ